MAKILLLISIASVQSKLAECVKPIDLFRSSNKFSLKIKELNEEISQHYKINELILPTGFEEMETCPNYILMEIEETGEPEEIERSVRKLESFCDNEFEIYVAVKKIEDEQKYQIAYSAVHQRLNNLKNMRFKPSISKVSGDGETLNPGKCIRCGINKIKSEEGYCSSCESLIKVENKSENFCSTVDIATEEWKCSVEKKKNQKIKDLIHRDSNFFHEEYCQEKGKLDKLRQLNDNVGFKASHYYALVQMDVDDFGKHMSGEYFNEQSKLTFKEYQKELSQKLNELEKVIKYALKFTKIPKDLRESRKKIIYMGGDDFLFFCPLYRLKIVMEVFKKKLEEINEDIKEYTVKAINISKSIVIAHEKTPFKKVIRESRELLEIAKNNYSEEGKNTISMGWFNSSTSKSVVMMQDKDYRLIENLFSQVEYFRVPGMRDAISSFEREFCMLEEGNVYNLDEHLLMIKIFHSEIDRILNHKLSKKEDVELISKNFKSLLDYFIENNKIDIKSYIHVLWILSCLAMEINEWGELSSEII